MCLVNCAVGFNIIVHSMCTQVIVIAMHGYIDYYDLLTNVK